jgi:hypothetical protein
MAVQIEAVARTEVDHNSAREGDERWLFIGRQRGQPTCPSDDI